MIHSNSNDADKLIEALKELRLTNRWSQEDLARKLSVSHSTVQRWETKGVKPNRLALKELQKLLKRNGLKYQLVD